MKNIYRNRAIGDLQLDEQDPNVLTFSCASSEPCLRSGKSGPYYEVLEISEESVNFDRLVDQRAPLLLQHDDDDQIGVVEKAYIEDGKLYVKVRFSKNQKPQEILSDIKDGIRRNVSIGYSVDAATRMSDTGYEYPVELVKKFTIVEVSIVSVPADATVGIGRSLETEEETIMKIKELDLTDDQLKKLKELLAEDEDKKDEEAAEDTAETTEEKSREAAGDEEQSEEKTKAEAEAEAKDEEKTDETKECGEEIEKKEEGQEETKECEDEEEIRSLGELVNMRALAEEYITSKRSLKEFKTALRNNQKLNVKDNTMEKKFSLRKALLNITGKMSDEEAKFERETIAENKRKFGINDADIVLSKKELRAFDGAEALNQTVYQPGMYTPNLRPPVTVDAVGTRKVAVTGPSISFSVCTSGLNAGYVDINGEVPSATMDFQLKTMTPKKAGAYVDISYQSLLQDDPSAEAIVMDDIVKALDQARDNAFWNGLSGNNQPQGLLNTDGVNTVTVPATPDIETALEFEKKIRESFDYSPNLKWCFSPDTYYKWAATPKKATAVNEFLIDDDRKCIGYDCFVDPNLPASSVILGNFDEALEASFDGITIKIVEDAALARKQAIEVVAFAANDFLLRRPKSFSKNA